MTILQPGYGLMPFLEELGRKGCELSRSPSGRFDVVKLRVTEPKAYPDGYFKDVCAVLSDGELLGVKAESPPEVKRSGKPESLTATVFDGKVTIGYEVQTRENMGGYKMRPRVSVSRWGGHQRGDIVSKPQESCLRLLSPPFLYGKNDVSIAYRRGDNGIFSPILEFWDSDMDHLFVSAELRGDVIWGTVWMNTERKELPFEHRGKSYSLFETGDRFTIAVKRREGTVYIKYPKQLDETIFRDFLDSLMTDTGWIDLPARRQMLEYLPLE